MVEQSLSLSRTMRKQLVHIGAEQHPILIIDNFVDNPEQLASLAQAGNAFGREKSDFYPGDRKPAPAGYSDLLHDALKADLCAIMGPAERCHLHVDLAVYSLVTTPVHKLRPIQCVPHIDSHNSEKIAAVHYLCPENFGGTSFYRHRSTGYESIDDSRFKLYFAKLKREVMDDKTCASTYINGSNALFERISQIELKFNRLIVYRSNCLHAGDIDPDKGLSPLPSEGRLTLNSFLHLSSGATLAES